MSNDVERQSHNWRIQKNTNPDITSRLSLECYISKLKSLKVGIAGILMIAVSYYCTTIPAIIPKAIGWFGVIFFGYALLAVTIRSFRSGIQVLIDQAGITIFRSKFDTIRWQDIKRIWVGAVREQKFLCIEIAHPEIYLSNLSSLQRNFVKVNESMGFPPITLSFSTLNYSLEDVVAFIRAKHPEKIIETA